MLVAHLLKIKKECIYQNELDKVCFQHDIAFGEFKDINRRTFADIAFNIAKYPKYDGYQRGLQWSINFFIKNW